MISCRHVVLLSCLILVASSRRRDSDPYPYPGNSARTDRCHQQVLRPECLLWASFLPCAWLQVFTCALGGQFWLSDSDIGRL